MEVLLIPGLFAGDASMAVLATWLRFSGHQPRLAGMLLNADCAQTAVEALEPLLTPGMAIVGQSRGGLFARVLAVRHPELVDRIVTLGSPLLGHLDVKPWLRYTMEPVARMRLPHLFTMECAKGACCSQYRDDLAAPFPTDVEFTSVYSRRDGVVDWHACLDPAAKHVEVRAGHIAMGYDPSTLRTVREALA
jgi:pimeloyl-ACP methyl ester carboxylesterase